MNSGLSWTRIALIVGYIICRGSLYAQYIEVTVKDAKTGEVIPSVYVKAVKQNEKFETISNPEGNIKLPIKCDSIIASHVAYESLRIDGNQLDKNILYLISKTTTLASITIYSTDLREKIEYVLKNFSRFYINNERTYHCTYKETLKVDDSLVRLLQFNLNWWDKEYEANLKKTFEYQNQVAIDAVSYSRTIEGKTVYSAALSNKSLFAALHLNNYLTGLLWQTKDYIILAIEKTNTSTKISFDAALENDGSIIGNLKDSYFIFDNKTNALLELHTQLIYADDRIEHVVSRKEKIPLMIKYKKEMRTMSFVEYKSKLRLSFFEHLGEHEDQIKNSTYLSENKLSLYIIGVDKGNIIPHESKLNLEEKSIYEYIENTPKKDPTILLTQEEQEFVKGNDNN